MCKNTDIELFISGDRQSFEKIYNYYVGKTYNFLYALTHDTNLSKDLTQNTFLQLWNAKEHLDASCEISNYIFTIAKNLLYRENRTRNIYNRYFDFVMNTQNKEVEPSIDDDLSREMIEKRILSLLALLPESRRRIFMMRWSEGMSNKEIAQKLSISEKTVSTQIHRVVEFLKVKIAL